uniref:Uncharacterized protein n=1 Tax=Rhizophora mucronata TaxID=61149 RepID=A0A2P2QQK7_RHIMU
MQLTENTCLLCAKHDKWLAQVRVLSQLAMIKTKIFKLELVCLWHSYRQCWLQ